MNCCFAIIPDGNSQPAALFLELEDAMDWGLQRYGGDAFKIRYVPVMKIESDGKGPSGD